MDAIIIKWKQDFTEMTNSYLNIFRWENKCSSTILSDVKTNNINNNINNRSKMRKK